MVVRLSDDISPFWFWEGGIPPNVCDQIINSIDDKHYAIGGVMEVKDSGRISEDISEMNIDKSIRKVYVQFTDIPWINSLMRGFILSANENNFLYDLSMEDRESCQISKYVGSINDSQYYNTHYDWVPVRAANAYTRKLSLSCQLTNPNDYVGGDLNLYLTNPSTTSPIKYTASKKQGTVIVFDSRIVHEVEPVTSGTRHSVVKWYHGDKPLR